MTSKITRESVSVVIPAHNAEKTIGEALISILKQTRKVLEIIVCDDSSQDDTVGVVQKQENGRVDLLFNKENIGPGRSRDKAIARASSPWVAFIDADDTWHPQRISRLLSAANSTGADIIFDDAMLCHHVNDRLVPWKPIHGTSAFGGKGNSPRTVPVEAYITSERLLVQPMIRTDLIRRHGFQHSSRRFAEDAEFYLRLALAGAKLCYVPEPLYYYRITPGSLTAQARDPTLMRKCLEECALWDGWWPSALDAFQKKIAALRTNEALYHLADAVRQRRFSTASRLLLSHPQLLPQLPRRLTRQLHYHAHRLVHGGCRR